MAPNSKVATNATIWASPASGIEGVSGVVNVSGNVLSVAGDDLAKESELTCVRAISTYRRTVELFLVPSWNVSINPETKQVLARSSRAYPVNNMNVFSKILHVLEDIL